MKANEAPEKLYFGESDKGILDIYSTKESDNEVEYTRTDAFIEKAVSYLKSKLYDWVQTKNPNQRSYANTIMKQDFVEDFRKYMEGE